MNEPLPFETMVEAEIAPTCEECDAPSSRRVVAPGANRSDFALRTAAPFSMPNVSNVERRTLGMSMGAVRNSAF